MKHGHRNQWNLLLQKSNDKRRKGTLVPTESTFPGDLDEDDQEWDSAQEGGYCNGSRPWDCPKSTHQSHRGSYCIRVGTEKQRPVGSLLSWKSAVSNIAFMWLDKSTDSLIWSQDIQKHVMHRQVRTWSWMPDQSLAKSSADFVYIYTIPIAEKAIIY